MWGEGIQVEIDNECLSDINYMQEYDITTGLHKIEISSKVKDSSI